MSITAIVELTVRPGQRDALIRFIEGMMADGPPMPGLIGATFYRAVDDPDVLVELAEWETAAAREAMLSEGEASGAFAPMFELLTAPPRVTLVEPVG